MFLLAGLMFLSYALIAANTRACAHARYGWVVVTDLIIAVVNFTVIKHVAEAQSWDEMVGYALGGAAGGLFGTWISRHWGDSEEA